MANKFYDASKEPFKSFVSKINLNLNLGISLSNAKKRVSYQIRGIKRPDIINLLPDGGGVIILILAPVGSIPNTGIYRFHEKTYTSYKLTSNFDSDRQAQKIVADYLRQYLQQNKVDETVSEDNKIWIFQASPNRYNLLGALSDPNVETLHWGINQYKDEIKKGDIALLWMAGKDAGIYAIADVISDPISVTDEADRYWLDEDSKYEKQLRVTIKIQIRLIDKPILKSKLEGISQLQNLGILRFSQGTNFSVTKEEWEVIKQEYPILQLGTPNTSDIDQNLVKEFHDETLEVYELGKRLYGYNATRFLQKIRSNGGLAAAKSWLNPKKKDKLPTEGFLKLVNAGGLDISLEALVLKDPWSKLFTDDELNVARERLQRYGYTEEEQTQIEQREKEILEDAKELKNEKREVVSIVIKRYEKVAKSLKVKYDNRCQIDGCGFTFEKENGKLYSEGHHLVPLSEDGSQSPDNVVILCPNHHRIFHYAKVEIGDIKQGKRKVKINGVNNFIIY